MHLLKFVLAAIVVSGAVAAPVDTSAPAVTSIAHTEFLSGMPSGMRHPHPSGSHTHHPHRRSDSAHPSSKSHHPGSKHPHPSGSSHPHHGHSGVLTAPGVSVTPA